MVAATVALMLALNWGGIALSLGLDADRLGLLAASALVCGAVRAAPDDRARAVHAARDAASTRWCASGTAAAFFGMGTFIGLTIYVPVYLQTVARAVGQPLGPRADPARWPARWPAPPSPAG